MFSFDPVLFALRLLPSFFRDKTTHRAWMRVLFGGLTARLAALEAHRYQLNRELTYTSQVLSMEKLLNDLFNEGLPGIYIEDIGIQPAQVFYYRLAESENYPKLRYLDETPQEDPVYLYRLGESLSDFDAIIHIPSSLIDLTTDTETASRVRAYVRRYAFLGVRFKLQNYAA